MKVGDLVRVYGRKVDIITWVIGRYAKLSSFPDNQVFDFKDLEIVNENR